MTKTRHQQTTRQQVIQVLGLSGDDLGKELKNTEEGKHKGRHCYLCGIHEGEKTIAVNVSGEEPAICAPKADLFKIARKVGEFTFEYDLCFHCSLLLDVKREA